MASTAICIKPGAANGMNPVIIGRDEGVSVCVVTQTDSDYLSITMTVDQAEEMIETLHACIELATKNREKVS